jgi:hypothetical protein
MKARAAAAAADPNNNPYLEDATERINRLRTVLDGFRKATLPLTPAQLRAARKITVEGLQKAARFAEEQPNVCGDLADVEKLVDQTQFLMAYEGLREQALFLLRDVDQVIDQCKFEAAKHTQGLYRIAKTYAVSAAAPTKVQAQVEILKPVFGRRRRPKPAPPADPDAPAVKK